MQNNFECTVKHNASRTRFHVKYDKSGYYYVKDHVKLSCFLRTLLYCMGYRLRKYDRVTFIYWSNNRNYGDCYHKIYDHFVHDGISLQFMPECCEVKYRGRYKLPETIKVDEFETHCFPPPGFMIENFKGSRTEIFNTRSSLGIRFVETQPIHLRKMREASKNIYNMKEIECWSMVYELEACSKRMTLPISKTYEGVVEDLLFPSLHNLSVGVKIIEDLKEKEEHRHLQECIESSHYPCERGVIIIKKRNS